MSKGGWPVVIVQTIIVMLFAAVADAQTMLPTTATNISWFGLPLSGIMAASQQGDTTDLEIFASGQMEFIDVESVPRLGPIFNSRSCGACHFQPAVGGSGGFINEVRVRNNVAGGPLHIFASDNLLRGGMQLQGTLGIFPNGLESTPIGCQITSPRCRKSRCQTEEARRTTFSSKLAICDPTSSRFAAGTNCVAERQSTPLFGLGLVEAVWDSTFESIAITQPPEVRGTVKRVTEFGISRVARFGWKDDAATLRAFSGDAYLNEMGITSPDFPTERSTCAQDQLKEGIVIDEDDDPEDEIEDDGRADVDRFADFMRALDAPPTLQQTFDAQAGQTLFNQVGCGGCHVANMTTHSNPAYFIPPTTGGVPITATLNALLANKTFHPYSDFLLHDMGSLGDGIASGAAGPTMMRTAPLWGVRAKSRYLHDGRATTLMEAITLHDGQAAAARTAFLGLLDIQQQRVIDFLKTI